MNITGMVANGTSNEVTVGWMQTTPARRTIVILDEDGEPAAILSEEQARTLWKLIAQAVGDEVSP